MGKENGKVEKEIVQNLSIESRERVFISGVLEVVSFDEHFIDVKTELGRLLVRGESLKLVNLSPENRELQVSGFIYSCEYEDGKRAGKGVFKRITR